MHDHPAQRRAPLAGGAGGGERDAAHDEFDVGRRRDDRRVVAAEFEDAATESGGDDAGDLLAHSRRAGRADERDAGVRHQRGADVGAAEQNLAEVFGSVDSGGRLLEQGTGGDRGQRRQVARLPDHRVAADDGERRVPAPHGDREVERGDHRGRAERMPLLHQPVAGAFAGDRQAVQLPAETDGEVADVDHLLHLAERLALDLADLDLHQIGRDRPCGCAAARRTGGSAHRAAGRAWSARIERRRLPATLPRRPTSHRRRRRGSNR